MGGDENLFDGVSIMSPEEMASSASEKTTADENVDETVQDNDGLNGDKGLTIEPGSTESGETIDNEKDGLQQPESTESNSNDNEDNIEQTTNKYAALISDLQSEGIITVEEEENLQEELKNASPETIKKLMESTIEKQVESKTENWKQGFDGAKKRFLDIEDAFDDTNYAIQMAQRLDYLDNLNPEDIQNNVELQKQIYAEDLRTTKNYSDEEIREAIEEADALDKLADKASKSLPSLKQHTSGIVEQSREQKAKRQEELMQKHEKEFNQLLEEIDSKEEFIDGLKLNKTVREKIKNNITTPVHKDENGKEYTSLGYKQKTSPKEFQMLINYYDSIGLFNIDKEGKFKPDISKFKNVAKTKATSELERVIEREDSQGIGRRNSAEGSDQTESALSLLKEAFKHRK